MPTKEELENQLESSNTEIEALREQIRLKDEELAKGGATTVVVGNVPPGYTHYKYPRWIYPKDAPTTGRYVRTAEEEALLVKAKGKDYWADTPAKHGVETHPEAVL